jgi:uncharacterized protein YuzE
VSYDAEGDLLELHFGAPRPSCATHAQDGVLVFLADDDGSVTGISIHGASRRAGIDRPPLKLPITADVAFDESRVAKELEEVALERIACGSGGGAGNV